MSNTENQDQKEKVAKTAAKKSTKAKKTRGKAGAKGITAKKAAELEATISDLQDECNKQRNIALEAQKQFLYEQAELENYKRRMEKRRLEDLTFATERIVKDLLPVLDNFDRALGHVKETGQLDEGFATGIDQISVQLKEALASHGLSESDPMGEKFDPNIHEAVAMVPGAGDNTVMAVQEKGYTLKDRMLRPAKVVVSTLAS